MRARIYKNIEDGNALCDGEKLTEELRETMKTKLKKMKVDLESKGKTREEIAVLKGVWMRCEGIFILWKGMHTLPLRSKMLSSMNIDLQIRIESVMCKKCGVRSCFQSNRRRS